MLHFLSLSSSLYLLLLDEVHSARTFLYDGEAECDANADLILESIENAARVGGRQFVAMKMTAIAKVYFCVSVSTLAVLMRGCVARAARKVVHSVAHNQKPVDQ